MPDFTYTSFPIEADEVDIDQIEMDISNAQSDILNLQQNKVDKTQTVNGKALNGNITLTPSDVGAVPTTRTINGKALSTDVALSVQDIGSSDTDPTSPTYAMTNVELTAFAKVKMKSAFRRVISMTNGAVSIAVDGAKSTDSYLVTNCYRSGGDSLLYYFTVQSTATGLNIYARNGTAIPPNGTQFDVLIVAIEL